MLSGSARNHKGLGFQSTDAGEHFNTSSDRHTSSVTGDERRLQEKRDDRTSGHRATDTVGLHEDKDVVSETARSENSDYSEETIASCKPKRAMYGFVKSNNDNV